MPPSKTLQKKLQGPSPESWKSILSAVGKLPEGDDKDSIIAELRFELDSRPGSLGVLLDNKPKTRLIRPATWTAFRLGTTPQLSYEAVSAGG